MQGFQKTFGDCWWVCVKDDMECEELGELLALEPVRLLNKKSRLRSWDRIALWAVVFIVKTTDLQPWARAVHILPVVPKSNSAYG